MGCLVFICLLSHQLGRPVCLSKFKLQNSHLFISFLAQRSLLHHGQCLQMPMSRRLGLIRSSHAEVQCEDGERDRKEQIDEGPALDHRDGEAGGIVCHSG